MSTFVVQEIIDNITYDLIQYFDTKECYDLVNTNCNLYWGKSPRNDSKDNYQFGDNAPIWSLGPMLLNNSFEGGFSLMSIDKKPWAFAGIRKYTNDIAIVLSRHFCFPTIKPITHGLLLPFQIQIAKNLGYKKVWITLNTYNAHLYDTWHVKEFQRNRQSRRKNKLYVNSDQLVSICKNLGKTMVNNTEQLVLEYPIIS
jgi:hypothetical protein